ncbi:FAD/NAD(P)-binding protein [Olleya sp.]|jgi:uncharacterized NAD(P)/FAD-binding protein YdhS|uniref:FAD/NAD(P)-binding protein n=1 Tax=Olleya sp. TaxID=1906788 RepID=UPI0032D93B2C
MSTPKTTTIAIIGCGPRGLSALENIMIALSNTNLKTLPKIVVFEKSAQLGCGSIYNLDQPDTNWLNISERALTIAKRPVIQIENAKIEGFMSYHDWTGKSQDAIYSNKHEVFPKRSEVGKYLKARYTSIAQTLQKLDVLTVFNSEVTEVKNNNQSFTITVDNGNNYNADEVVLTIGHQETKTSKQLKDWINYAQNNNTVNLFLKAYPIKHLLSIDYKNIAHTVGLRGFGLATIDVIRAITKANGGCFEVIDTNTHKMNYHPGKSTLKLIPFSLDGLPMACKPLNSKIDALFTPSNAKILSFKSELLQIKEDVNYNNGNTFLIKAMATIVANQYLKLGNHAYQHNFSVTALKTITEAYLKDENFKHELLLSQDNAPEVIIQAYVDMATAKQPISLDYCLGQVWRHCQPTLYAMMSHSALQEDVINKVIALDERIKRYAFGPPIESLQQILALTYQGTLDLNFVNNPEINLTDNGWQLQKHNQEITVNTMINAVLDSPKIEKVISPIVTNLLNDNLIQAIHSKLGVDTKQNGLVVSKNKKQTLNLAVLGRLAKGSVVGVDAILECFGPRIKDWADGLVERLNTDHPA